MKFAQAPQELENRPGLEVRDSNVWNVAANLLSLSRPFVLFFVSLSHSSLDNFAALYYAVSTDARATTGGIVMSGRRRGV